MAHKFLTPDTIETLTDCFPLAVSQGLMRYVYWSLGELAKVENWELHGAITPELISQYFADIIVNLEEGCGDMGILGRMDIWNSGAQSFNSGNPAQLVEWSNAQGTATMFQADLLAHSVEVLQDCRLMIDFKVSWNSNGTGFRQAVLRKNGLTEYMHRTIGSVVSGHDQSFFYQSQAIEGDTFDVTIFQNSGAPLGIVAATGWGPHMRLTAFSNAP